MKSPRILVVAGIIILLSCVVSSVLLARKTADAFMDEVETSQTLSLPIDILDSGLTRASVLLGLGVVLGVLCFARAWWMASRHRSANQKMERYG